MPELAAVRDIGLADRFARSAASPATGAADVLGWLSARARANHFRVERIPLGELGGWEFSPVTGNLRRRSGRFFTIEGMHVVVDGTPQREWYQPVINQPESGIVGILAKEFDGVLHFLMQAKMEPGNCNLLQLSPTVQATRSNYKKVHRGGDVKYLDYFAHPRPTAVLVDVLQSEPGAWFFRKTNRNMIVETTGEVPLLDDFRWLTLGEIGELLRCDNVVNMDARSVLGCAPVARDGELPLHSDFELQSWFTEIRSRRTLIAERVPLLDLPGWVRGGWSIDHVDGGHFSVVAVSTEAGNREVTSWSQPLVEPNGLGINAFLCTEIHGTLHVLAHARVEAGLADEVELAPTVQATLPEDRPLLLDHVLSAEPARIRFQAMLSEEGGRLLNAENRYLVVDTEYVDAPPGYHWVTPGQLYALVKHSHYVNSQARTLLACLNATADR